jgi:hypothetical protein
MIKQNIPYDKQIDVFLGKIMGKLKVKPSLPYQGIARRAIKKKTRIICY